MSISITSMCFNEIIIMYISFFFAFLIGVLCEEICPSGKSCRQINLNHPLNDDVSTFALRHYQVKVNKNKFEFKNSNKAFLRDRNAKN